MQPAISQHDDDELSQLQQSLHFYNHNTKHDTNDTTRTTRHERQQNSSIGYLKLSTATGYMRTLTARSTARTSATVVSRCSKIRIKTQKPLTGRLPPVIAAIARPPAAGIVGGALVVALLVEQLPAAAGVEAAAPADVALNFVSSRELVPVHGGERGVLREQGGRQERLRRHLRELLRLRHAEILLREGAEIGLLLPPALLLRFFFQQRTDAHATGLGPEMPSQCIGASESPTASPVVVVLEVTAADKLLLARVQPLVPLAVMLAGKGLSTHTTHKRPLICVSAQMRAQIVRAGEALRAEGALERRGMLLRALGVAVSGDGARGVGEVKDVVTVGHAGRRRAA
jgi:hypothetical protein